MELKKLKTARPPIKSGCRPWTPSSSTKRGWNGKRGGITHIHFGYNFRYFLFHASFFERHMISRYDLSKTQQAPNSDSPAGSHLVSQGDSQGERRVGWGMWSVFTGAKDGFRAMILLLVCIIFWSHFYKLSLAFHFLSSLELLST